MNQAKKLSRSGDHECASSDPSPWEASWSAREEFVDGLDSGANLYRLSRDFLNYPKEEIEALAKILFHRLSCGGYLHSRLQAMATNPETIDEKGIQALESAIKLRCALETCAAKLQDAELTIACAELDLELEACGPLLMRIDEKKYDKLSLSIPLGGRGWWGYRETMRKTIATRKKMKASVDKDDKED